MLYRQKNNTFIRHYDDVGYIINFTTESDRVVDASGAVFLSALSRDPQTIDSLCNKILASFIDTDFETIKNSAKEFFSVLEHDGFIVSGQSKEELDVKDPPFSYASKTPVSLQSDYSSIIPQSKLKPREFLAERFKDRPQLTFVQIEITNRCNERCVHCYIPHQYKTTDIEPGLFYSILEQCHDMDIINLSLSGGELMLHKHFLDFLRKTKEYDFSIGILSNLTLLNDDIISEIKSARLTNVQTSLYSMNPQTHDAITKLPGSFHKTSENILRLVENDVPVNIACPIMKQNKNHYKDVMAWAREHKCQSSTSYLMMARYDHSIDNLNNRLSLEETKTLIDDIIKNNSAYHHQTESLMDEYLKTEGRYKGGDLLCGAGVFSLSIAANGNIIPCAGWQDRICGSLYDSPLREIWEKSPQIKYLRNLRLRDFPKCLSCFDRKFCKICMARNANENPKGDPLITNDHFCKAAELNRKLFSDWKDQQMAG